MPRSVCSPRPAEGWRALRKSPATGCPTWALARRPPRRFWACRPTPGLADKAAASWRRHLAVLCPAGSRRPGPRTLDPAFFLKAWAAGRSAGRWARSLPATRVRSPRRQAPLQPMSDVSDIGHSCESAPLVGRLRKRPSTEQGRGDYAGGYGEGDEYFCEGRRDARLRGARAGIGRARLTGPVAEPIYPASRSRIAG
jgi:hypothetical protein